MQLREFVDYQGKYCLTGCVEQIAKLLIEKPELRGQLLVIDTRTGLEVALDLNHANQPVIIDGKNRKLIEGNAQHLIFCDETVTFFQPTSFYQNTVNPIHSPLEAEAVGTPTARTMGYIIDGLRLIAQNSRKDKLVAQLPGGEKVELTLSIGGQVAYISGRSIKILPDQAVLTAESDLLIAEMIQQEKMGLIGNVEQIRNQALRAHLAAIIDGAGHNSTFGAKLEKREAGEDIIAVAQTDFKVEYASLPRNNYGLQARLFYKAALDSIEKRKREIDESGQRVLRIESIGNIVNDHRVKDGFEHRMISNGNLDFHEVASGQTFIKYFVGRNYKAIIK